MGILGIHNIGKVLEKRLCDVGIDDIEKLKTFGTEEVFLKLYEKNKNTSRSVLYAIEGAIEGIRWHDLDPERKHELEIFFDSVATQ